MLIADGHHRYGVARIYRDEVGDAASGADLTLCFVGELVAEQLSVEAIHRLYTGMPADQLAAELEHSFELTPIDPPTAATLTEMERDGHLVLLGPGTAQRMTPRPGAFDDVRALDGVWLEHALRDVAVDVTYQHGLDEVLDAVDKRRRGRGCADPPRQRRRDRTHGTRRPVDAAEVDVLHPQAAHRIRHPPNSA